MSTENADYLDTPTLSGAKGYFHGENDATHRTDGKATGTSPETPLVAASRGGSSPAARETQQHATATANTATITPDVTTPEGDGLDRLSKAELTRMAKQNGVPIPRGANKAALVRALRG